MIDTGLKGSRAAVVTGLMCDPNGKSARKQLMELDGKIALVTGASSGIGREVALQLGAAGATLALSARREADLTTVAEQLPSEASIHVADLGEPVEALRLADAVVAEHGRVDILVAVAGIKVAGPISALSLDDLSRAYLVNAASPMALAGRLAPAMVERKSGLIATVTTSISGGRRDLGAYAGSKAALGSMTQSLRQEIGAKGVAVFCFDPGWVRTRMSPDGTEEPSTAAARLVEHIKLGKGSRETLT